MTCAAAGCSLSPQLPERPSNGPEQQAEPEGKRSDQDNDGTGRKLSDRRAEQHTDRRACAADHPGNQHHRTKAITPESRCCRWDDQQCDHQQQADALHPDHRDTDDQSREQQVESFHWPTERGRIFFVKTKNGKFLEQHKTDDQYDRAGDCNQGHIHRGHGGCLTENKIAKPRRASGFHPLNDRQ